MAKRGRKPKPATLKVVTHGASGLPAGELEPPAHLGPEGRAEWRLMAEVLAPVLKPADAPALGIYCSAFERWQRAQRQIDSDGLTVETAAGGIKAHPLHPVVNAALRTMGSLLAELGLTPSARQRLEAGRVEPPKDDLADFLARKKG